jgi:hypothetical protein
MTTLYTDEENEVIRNQPNHLWELVQSNPDKEWYWEELSQNPNITWEIIQANPDKPWDWWDISSNPNITWEIIQTNPDKDWDWNAISFNLFHYNKTVLARLVNQERERKAKERREMFRDVWTSEGDYRVRNRDVSSVIEKFIGHE